jgi:hypothetical protein
MAYEREAISRAKRRRGIEVLRDVEQPKRLRNSDFDNNIGALFMDSVCDLRRLGKRWKALQTGIQCSRLHPMDFHYHKAFAYALMPAWLVRKVRKFPV